MIFELFFLFRLCFAAGNGIIKNRTVNLKKVNDHNVQQFRFFRYGSADSDGGEFFGRNRRTRADGIC